MHTIESLRTLLLAKPAAEETYPFGPNPLVTKVGGKMFALLSLDAEPIQLSLKVEPESGDMLRSSFPAIQPGYHLNKRHWVTLTLDGSLDPGMVEALIDESYRLVVRGLSRAVRAGLNIADSR
jgi:predicted DNA-binding protein (MmcQ/YjbR family)